MSVDEHWRPLVDQERSLIQKLLSVSFSGRKELLLQLEHATVRRIEDDGSIEFRIDKSAPRASVSRRVPVEGETVDVDGVGILILLHVVEGRLQELEIVKGDSTAIRQPPVASDVTVRAGGKS